MVGPKKAKKHVDIILEWHICSDFYNLYLLIIDELAYLIVEASIKRLFMHIMLTMAEMVIFKIIYMFKFSMIAALDEYFFTNFVTIGNVMINFVFAIIRIILGESYRTKTYFLSFAKPIDVYEKIPWP